MKKPSANELLAAIRQVPDPRPGPDWFTVTELRAIARAEGKPLGLTTLRLKLQGLEKAGKAERRNATHRTGGIVPYWRFTNGHRPSS